MSSSDLVQASDEVRNEMLAKHTWDAPLGLPALPSHYSVSIVEPVVVKALSSFTPDYTSSPSSLIVSHLKEAIFYPSSSHGCSVLQTLTKVIDLFSSGLAPLQVVPHWCGAAVMVVRKKDGGVQPTAAGEVFWWPTFKFISCVVNVETSNTVSHLKLGIGVHVGCDSIVHAVNSELDNNDTPSGSK